MPPNHESVRRVDSRFRDTDKGCVPMQPVGNDTGERAIIDPRGPHDLARALYEVTVGFKWYVAGLLGTAASDRR